MLIGNLPLECLVHAPIRGALLAMHVCMRLVGQFLFVQFWSVLEQQNVVFQSCAWEVNRVPLLDAFNASHQETDVARLAQRSLERRA